MRALSGALPAHSVNDMSRKRSWIGSVQGAVATWSVISTRYFLMIPDPYRDQVATAPCTDPIQVWNSTVAWAGSGCELKCAF